MFLKKGKHQRIRRKLMCLFMALIFIMGSMPLEALAADPPEVTSITYERTRTTDVSVAETNQLIIYGANFTKPEVWGGQFGEKKLTIDVAKSDVANGKIVVSDLSLVDGILAKIKIKDGGLVINGTGTTIDLREIATITGVSSNKVYIGGKLDILGIKLDTVNGADDLLYVAGTAYSTDAGALDPALTVSSSIINISTVKPPGSTGNNEVKLIKNFPLVGSVYTQIIVKYTNSVSVVQPIVGVDVERVDPNTGAKDKLNTVTLYGKAGFCNFLPSMRIFVSKNGIVTEGTTVGIVEDSAKLPIGIKVTLPMVASSGVADLILKTSDLTGEYIKANGFTYVDADNGLSIDPPPNGISPASKKETEKMTVTITGRNMGYFSAAGYDKVTAVSAPTNLGYDISATYPNFTDNNFYKVMYTAKYNGVDVVIIREISVTISDYARVDETLPLAQQLQISSSGDIIKVVPVDVAIVEPKKASVTVKTQTTVFLASDQNDIKFARVEEYAVQDGFTFVPDETVPEVKSITPTYAQDPVKGPITDGIYVTLKGVNFQVEIDKVTQLPVVPTVELTNGFKTRTLTNVIVYTDNNDVVDGKSNSLGTKIKCRIPNSGTEIFSGAFDVVVTNPSRGKFTFPNGFTFKNPDVGAKLPEVYSAVESYADIKGGKVTGETVKLTGKNFDTSAVDTQRIKVTIDGEYCEFTKDKETGKFGVSADGKTVTIIPPPGTVAGFTKLQIINEDGGVASIDFEYKKVTTSPKITKVTPIYGTKGTKIVIKGESFILPDKTGLTVPSDPAFKGSYVLFNGNELNAYNYTPTGALAADLNNSIYCTENGLNGQMVEVIDSSTIIVTVPDNFYKFKANPAATNFFDLLEATPLVVGAYSIEVRNPDGAKTKEKFSFNYMKPVSTPTIGSIDPNYASVTGGTVVTIIGSGFLKTDLAVFFGTEPATKVEYVSATELRVMVPAYPYTLAMGVSEVIVPVTVLNYDGGSASYYYIDPTDHTKDKIFKYKVPDSKPSIKSVDPLKGSTSGGDKLKINGKDFRRTSVGVNEPKVYINGISAPVEWIGDLNSTEWLTVTTPSSLVEGPVDIVLVNFDSGTATFKGFSYVKTKPVIKSFIPNLIALKGNSNGLITGSNFTKWNNMEDLVTIKINPDSSRVKEVVNVGGTNVAADTVLDTLVYFGDSGTKDKIVLDTVSGVPYDFMDNLRFDVTRLSDSETRVVMSLASDTTHTAIAGKDMNIGTGKAHLFIMTGDQQGKPGVADEGILVEVTTDQVSIQRRIAPQAKLGDQDFYAANSYSSAMVTTPPFSKIGKRLAYIRNGDGAIASIGVEVTNPLSNPQITGVLPRSAYKDRTTGTIKIITTGGLEPNIADVMEWYTYIPLAGGVQLTINGSDFRENVKVYLNEKVMEIVSRSATKDKLLIKIPAGVASDTNLLKSLIVINEDGGSVNSGKLAVPHYIMYKDATSSPIIKSLSRTKTSQNKYAQTESELNIITLIGYGFIPGMRAFVGNVECPKVELDKSSSGVYDDTHARITIPKDLPLGPNLLQIINPDNGFFELKNAITVISDPKIDAVYTDKGALISPITLSIEGQSIKLTGDGFTEGEQVIIGGTLKPSTYVPTSTDKVTKCTNSKDEDVMVIGGVFASDVKLVAATATTAAYLTLKTPRQDLGATSIIVLATDGGVSNSLAGDYQKPYPDKPTGLYAAPVDSDTVKLEWPLVEGIRYYEVYVCKSNAFKNDSANDKYEYKGSITPIDLGTGVLRSFVEGLEPNTYYSFKLKSVNNFGASKFSDASAKYIVNTTTGKTLGFVKTFATSITDYFQTTTNYKNTYSVEDKLSYQGRMSIMTAGERSMQSRLLTVAYNKPEFVLNDPKVLDINVDLLKKYRDVTILIDDYSLSLKMTSQDMITVQAEALGEADAKDAKMRVTIDKRQGTSADQIRIRIPSGYGMVLQPMKIGLDLYQGQTSTPQTAFSNQVAASFKYAVAKKAGYPGGIYVAYYNTYTRKIELMGTTEGTGTADSQIQKTGSYIILGKKTK